MSAARLCRGKLDLIEYEQGPARNKYEWLPHLVITVEDLFNDGPRREDIY